MEEVVEVNFDYYDVDGSNDYHAIRRLLVQLFCGEIDAGALTEVVVRVAEESGVGSTIKTEEEESTDPSAVLTAISCREHDAGVHGLIAYVLSKTTEEFQVALSAALGEHVGLVVSERLVNMPVQVMGPMYRMLADEMATARSSFSHLLFLSRLFRTGPDIVPFHAEDAEIAQHASHVATYAFSREESHVIGQAMLVPSSEFKVLVDQIAASYPV